MIQTQDSRRPHILDMDPPRNQPSDHVRDENDSVAREAPVLPEEGHGRARTLLVEPICPDLVPERMESPISQLLRPGPDDMPAELAEAPVDLHADGIAVRRHDALAVLRGGHCLGLAHASFLWWASHGPSRRSIPGTPDHAPGPPKLNSSPSP
jgi:hypothetical protein